MMEILNPTYTLEVIITDRQVNTKVGKAQFWNYLAGKTGCDEAVKYVKKALEDAGIEATVLFKRFEHK